MRWGSGHVVSMLVMVLAAWATNPRHLAAQEDNTRAEQPSSQATDEEIGQLIQQLDSPRFPERQAASRKLAALGLRAIPALEEAARGDSREAAQRALEILRQHLQQGDQQLKDAARQALERVAQSEARTAEEAKRILQPPARRPPANLLPGAPAQIQIQVGRMAGAKRIVARNVNGKKEITVTEKDRTIQIQEQPNGKITVEITKQEGDKKKTEKIEADSADDLKKKSPEAYKLYEQYAKGGPLQLQFNVPGGVPQVPAIQLQLAPQAPAPNQKQLHKELEQAIEQLDQAIRDLKEQVQGQEGKKAIERLQQVREQLEGLKKEAASNARNG